MPGENDQPTLEPTLITPAGGEGIENLGGELDTAFADFQKGSEPKTEGGDSLNGGEPKAEPKAEGGEPKAEPKAEGGEPKTEPKAEPKAEQDEFDKHQLPAHARPSTAKQFDEVKAIGRRLVAEEKAKVEALTKELSELKSKQTAPGELPKEVQDELTKLRSIVNRTSYQESPDFVKNHAEPIAKAEDAVWKALKDVGYDDATVAKAKQLGIDQLDWEKALTGADFRSKQKVSAALATLDSLKTSRDEAIAKAASDAEAYKKAIADAPDRSKVELETGVAGALQMLEGNKFFEELTAVTKPKDLPDELLAAYNAGGAEAKKFIEVAKAGEFTMGELIALGAASQRYVAINTALNKNVSDLRAQAASEKARADKAEAEVVRIRGAGAAPKTPAGAPGKGVVIDDADDMDDRFRQFAGGQP